MKDVTFLDCPDPFKDKVKCTECKHWIDKSDASSVLHRGGIYYSQFIDWYCPMHKKPYTRYIMAFPNNLYYGEVRMEEDGTPVGYKKIDKK